MNLYLRAIEQYAYLSEFKADSQKPINQSWKMIAEHCSLEKIKEVVLELTTILV